MQSIESDRGYSSGTQSGWIIHGGIPLTSVVGGGQGPPGVMDSTETYDVSGLRSNRGGGMRVYILTDEVLCIAPSPRSDMVKGVRFRITFRPR